MSFPTSHNSGKSPFYNCAVKGRWQPSHQRGVAGRGRVAGVVVSGRVARALPPATLSAPLQGALELLHLDSRARPQSITALSEGSGYGAAGGEGLFSSCKISQSLTHRVAVP